MKDLTEQIVAFLEQQSDREASEALAAINQGYSAEAELESYLAESVEAFVSALERGTA